MKPDAPYQTTDGYYDDSAEPWWMAAPRCAGEDCNAAINEDDGELCAECRTEADSLREIEIEDDQRCVECGSTQGGNCFYCKDGLG